MRLNQIFPPVNLTLLEAKARIEHPEDMILDGGVKGAQSALQILQATADKPHSLSLKWDGSPSLIMGWRGDEFILTDKAGFGAKGYDGLTTSAEDLEHMIMARKMKDTSPEAMQARKQYAVTIAGLYDRLKHVVPRDFKGFAQGDLMWTKTPTVVSGAYEFKPVKITYRIPVDSDLGKQIAQSEVGMVIHSVYDSPQDQEPTALRDVHDLGFKNTAGVMILPHELTITQPLSLDPHGAKQAQQLIKSNQTLIQEFFDPVTLTDNQIKALPSIMKSFVAYKAGQGEDDFHDAPEQFLMYIQSPVSKVSAAMLPRIQSWIQDHVKAYNMIWRFVHMIVGLKMDLKRQIDAQVGQTISAQLRQTPGHEGFVSVTPQGIIKLVHRAEFMKKMITEAEQAPQEDAPRVVFSFMRANPPTLGHKMVMDKVAQQARGDDYWVFLSQSQDAKKNPLDWQTKMHFAQLLMPEHKSHLAHGSEFMHIKTPLLAMDWLYEQGYRHMIMVVGSDRVDSMRDILQGWNSDEIRTKYGRDPVHIEVVSAGERDPDAEGVSGISASQVRELARAGNYTAFKQAVGLADAHARELFDQVRKGMKLKQHVTITEQTSDFNHESGTIVMLRMSDKSAHGLVAWCDRHEIPCMDPEHYHITVLFSKTPVPHLTHVDGHAVNVTCVPERWQILGSRALTLVFDCAAIDRLHHKLIAQGGSHSYDDFIAHTTVNYYWPHAHVPQVLPDFPLVFDVIQVKPIDPNYAPPVK